ncbi:MAG: hypothetical protein D6694_13940 [Gammaproteobacteria bacterium]|nr:MAG: hypothetical protein D6694_13940 [Gammaproteobacteria bacterium]
MDMDKKVKSIVRPAWLLVRPYWKRTARFRHQARIRLISLLGLHGRKQPLFVLARQRTGSNLLLDYLNSIPQISMAHEFLNPEFYYGFRPKSGTKEDLFRHIERSLNALPGEISGCKILIGQFDLHGITLEDLHNLFPEAKFLVLYRRSILKQFVSLKIARTTKQYLANDPTSVRTTNVTITLDELEEFYQLNNAEYQSVLKYPWMREKGRLIVYEDLAVAPQETFDNVVFPFLNIPRSKIQTSLVKQGKRPVEEVVENYASIKDHLDKYLMYDPQNYFDFS